MNPNPDLKIFAGRNSHSLAIQVAQKLGLTLGNVHMANFSDGEFQPSYEESVRGANVFIIQSTPPPSETLMELLMLIDAAKRASAKSIVALIPYFGWARQDRKDKPRVPITAKLVANLLVTSGVTRIITMDLHADQIQGFFELPVDHLFASAVFIPYIQTQNLSNLAIASPDMGGSKRATVYAKHLNADLVICYKHREKPNEVGEMRVIGDVKGKNVVLVDDMVDTGGTLLKAAEMIMNQGALSVRAMCSHPILSGNAYERIQASRLTELVVTDTLPLREQKNRESKIRVVSIADLFAHVVRNVAEQKSISESFIY